MSTQDELVKAVKLQREIINQLCTTLEQTIGALEETAMLMQRVETKRSLFTMTTTARQIMALARSV
jgi:hypothetical protein